MAVFSFKEQTISGPNGTTYTFNDGGLDLPYLVDGTYEGRTYLEIEDISQFPEQDSHIDFKEDTLPAALLAQLMQPKLDELDTVSGQYDSFKCPTMYVTSSLGFKFNADARSELNIQGLIRDLSDDTSTTLFKDYDNQYQTVTKADLQTMLDERIKLGQSLYQQKWSLLTQIEACKSLTELNAIEIVFTMSDFTASV